MAEKFASRRNIDFLLYEMFDVESLTRHPFFADHGRESFDVTMDTAYRIAAGTMLPVLRDMDRHPPRFEDGTIRVHRSVRTFMKECGEGGWIGATLPASQGGQQLPDLVAAACKFFFLAANYSLGVYPVLTFGAAHLILNFGSDALRSAYCPELMAGRWQGTMALTEPGAGSSLADIATRARPAEGGHYLIEGQKIFISAGDHDGAENVVHLMLARIEGAPPGVRGISLFVVPKLRPEAGGLVPNDVTCAGTYHKLGYRGCPIAQLSMGDAGDCRGYLVGEPHRGLSYMFQMMNEARVDVGMSAAATATAAYYASLEYARERPQGRRPAEKDPTRPQIPIIRHADVRRMLLFQRAVTEGALALCMQCFWYVDRMKITEGDERERCALLLDLLTPMAKSYPSEMGVLSVGQGLQCMGGYGYCDDFPLELYYRDIRIHPIHEGTTGIHGMDLLGRKVMMQNGRALSLFVEEAEKDAAAADELPAIAAHAGELRGALDLLKGVTAHLAVIAGKGNTELFLADSVLYLTLFGTIAVAWQWLRQAAIAARALAGSPSSRDANFYRGKLLTCRYFFRYELPAIHTPAARLKDCDGLTVDMDEALFDE